MRSTRRLPQRGASLIETLVASARLASGVVAGLTAWDTASMSASRAIRLAWGNCVARAELDAILSAPFADSYDQPAPPAFVGVTIAPQVSRGADGSPGE